MSRAEAAGGLDRLPWLPDKPASSPRWWGSLIGAAAVIVFAGAYWIDIQGKGSRPQPNEPLPIASTTVRLPAARAAESAAVRAAPQVSVKLTQALKVRSTPTTAIHELPPPTARPTVRQYPASSSARPARRPAASRPLPRKPAPAPGRLIQVGAFGSTAQAEHALAVVVGRNPALAHLKAAVVQSRNSKERTYYRFQVGTTSQAHSEVLCQRMRKISLSCTVDGMPRTFTGAER
jgi:hypothetical protein